MAAPALGNPVTHVVIFVQENHTTDNYFRSMAVTAPTSTRVE